MECADDRSRCVNSVFSSVEKCVMRMISGISDDSSYRRPLRCGVGTGGLRLGSSGSSIGNEGDLGIAGELGVDEDRLLSSSLSCISVFATLLSRSGGSSVTGDDGGGEDSGEDSGSSSTSDLSCFDTCSGTEVTPIIPSFVGVGTGGSTSSSLKTSHKPSISKTREIEIRSKHWRTEMFTSV